jgi:prepilin-type N-terminal cleavage/methylation domain-containing protein/prepilin-type processing-associated H-X9-DG protein
MKKNAFTIIELLVVVAVLVLLAATLLPALAKTSLNGKTLQCINNHRQLVNAWRMYADDNRDVIVYAAGNSSTPTRDPYAWTLSSLDFNPNNRANWDITVDLSVRPLWAYGGKSAGIFKCPSDNSYVVPPGGVARPRVRSVSMNVFMGGFDGTTGGWPYLSGFHIFLKTTDLTSVNPANCFVFLDQRADNINSGAFATDMTGYSPNDPSLYEFNQDLPGMYHSLGCTFSFADGRVETKRWQDPRTTPPPHSPGTLWLPTISSPNNPDIAWLQGHATRPN